MYNNNSLVKTELARAVFKTAHAFYHIPKSYIKNGKHIILRNATYIILFSLLQQNFAKIKYLFILLFLKLNFDH